MPGDGGPDRLSLILYSGDPGKVHYGFALASAAAAIGRPVTLFFTMEAIRSIQKPGSEGAPDWAEIDRGHAEKGVATFAEMLSALVELKARFLVCEMGLRAVGLEKADLRDDIEIETGGIVTMLGDASKDGAILFI